MSAETINNLHIKYYKEEPQSLTTPTGTLVLVPESTPALVETANKLSVTTVGSTTRPVYFSNGVPIQCDKTLGAACEKSVDTSMSLGTTSTNLPTSKAVNDMVSLNFVRSISMNGSTKTMTSGEVNLGTVLTSHQSVTDYQTTLQWGSYNTLAKVGSTDIHCWMPDEPTTCLLKGTQITMADGTKKAIEDVRRGDVVLSYDPKTNNYTTGIVLQLRLTGSHCEGSKQYFFEDGKSLRTYRKHIVYKAKDETDCLMEHKYHGTDRWNCKDDKYDYALDEALNEIRYIGSEDIITIENVDHYDLVVSTIGFFADGILCGSAQWSSLVNFYHKCEPFLTIETKTAYHDLLIELADLKPTPVAIDENRTSEFDYETNSLKPEYIDAYIERTVTKRHLVSLKKKMDKLDIKCFKHEYGALTDEEYATVLAEKEALLEEIRSYDEAAALANDHKRTSARYAERVRATDEEIVLLKDNEDLFVQIAIELNSQNNLKF